MNRRILIPLIAAAVFAALPATAATSAHEHGHGHHASQSRLTLDDGRKWATDEPLRREMAELRDALTFARKGRMTDAEYRALGDVVEYRVGRIVEECKLAPAADANLHVLVTELVGAADDLRAPGKAHAHHALRRATIALNEYGQYFDHPGWKPLR